MTTFDGSFLRQFKVKRSKKDFLFTFQRRFRRYEKRFSTKKSFMLKWQLIKQMSKLGKVSIQFFSDLQVASDKNDSSHFFTVFLPQKR